MIKCKIELRGSRPKGEFSPRSGRDSARKPAWLNQKQEERPKGDQLWNLNQKKEGSPKGDQLWNLRNH